MNSHRHLSLSGLLSALIILQGCTSSDELTAAPQPVHVAGFSTPESVLHDVERDAYLVTNINGSPIDKDDNGFISRLSPTGEVLDARWIDGASDAVTLNAPKGMALAGGRLYVADIDALRVFDAESGKPLANIEVPGATFLNDVAALPDGRIAVSDSGLTLKDGDFAPTGSDALIVIDVDDVDGASGAVTRLLSDPALPHPNGVTWANGQIWMCYFASNTLDSFDTSGVRQQHLTLPAGKLDGLVPLEDGRFLVSSWETSEVYAVDPRAGGDHPAVSRVASGLTSPADIGFDAARGRVLVPLFSNNEVVLLDAK